MFRYVAVEGMCTMIVDLNPKKAFEISIIFQKSMICDSLRTNSDPIRSVNFELCPKYWYATKTRRPMFVAGACLFCFFAALPMVTRGGMYVFQVRPYLTINTYNWPHP